MGIKEKVKKKFEDLINEGDGLKYGNKNGQIRSDQHRQECIGWLTSSQNVVPPLVRNPNKPYLTSIDKNCCFH